MTKNPLPTHFFDKNPLDELSAAQFSFFQMIALFESTIDDTINKGVKPLINSERLTAIED